VLRRLHSKADALPVDAFVALKTALLESPLVGRSTLAGPFQASRGFAVLFREAGRAEVLRHFPSLTPYFERALGRPAVTALTPWWRRPTRLPNAWYLNVLLVSSGGAVSRHVDATLRNVSGDEAAVPELVSVLYLQVPNAAGGELALFDGERWATRLAPRENQRVHFRGDLAHEVRPFEAAGQLRASLVIEQYHLAEAELARVPHFRLESKAGFSAYLHHHQHTPKRFTLE
jgi:2OG-Fe(II) oxygenase superfamily